MLKTVFKIVLGVAAAAGLAGCIIINADERDVVVDTGARACVASDHQKLIGTPGTAIDRATLPSSFRIICHGCPATMDFREDRLTVQLGPDGKVVSAACN
jgi:hypothetical protein